MTAPRSIELHEDILVVVEYDVREALSFQHLHIASEVLRAGLLTLQGGLQLTAEERSHEGFHTLYSVLIL